jgi:hypothetical protein
MKFVFVIQHIPTGDYLFGNRMFTPGIKYARRFETRHEAEQHELPPNKSQNCVIVEVDE